MSRHAFNVADTFEISGRGLIIASDKRLEDLPSWLALKIGDEVEFRSQGQTILRTRITGIPMAGPTTTFDFLVANYVTKSQVPIGCEVWVDESSVVD